MNEVSVLVMRFLLPSLKVGSKSDTESASEETVSASSSTRNDERYESSEELDMDDEVHDALE